MTDSYAAMTSPSSNAASSVNSDKNYTIPLVILTSLFFMWGFLTVMNDVLIPHLKAVFALNYFQAMAVNVCFFGAYFVVSYPAGALVKNIGYKRGVVTGLVIAGIGCLLFYPAASYRVYWIFLAALFVLASGITILQVSANPYVTRLGPPETASQRLTLTQAFNSLGTTVGPYVGSLLILSVATLGAAEIASLTPEELDAHHLAEAQAVQIPYVGLAIALIALAVVFALLKLPVIVDAEEEGVVTKSAWHHRHLILGAIGLFVYVGGEVAIGSLIVNFLGEANIANLPENQAGQYLMLYWGGAMVGRFIGVGLMQVLEPRKLLAIFAFIAALLVITAVVGSGSVAMWALLAVGLFNSIMFPTIFSLALNKLGAATSQGSGILCVAIVGGAVIPAVQGLLADNIGLQNSFFVPVLCYIYIIFYTWKGAEPKTI
jgi:FHS family L-fucose permease-like MFS transporter